jgi:hypothetical protein
MIITISNSWPALVTLLNCLPITIHNLNVWLEEDNFFLFFTLYLERDLMLPCPFLCPCMHAVDLYFTSIIHHADAGAWPC